MAIDETVRHEFSKVNLTEPVVVVLSAYDPLVLAVHVPVTWREPVTGADVQPSSSIDKSS